MGYTIKDKNGIVIGRFQRKEDRDTALRQYCEDKEVFAGEEK